MLVDPFPGSVVVEPPSAGSVVLLPPVLPPVDPEPSVVELSYCPKPASSAGDFVLVLVTTPSVVVTDPASC